MAVSKISSHRDANVKPFQDREPEIELLLQALHTGPSDKSYSYKI